MTTVQLTKDELTLAHGWGQDRARIMANKPDKVGSLRKGEFHSPIQADALGIAAEIAACKYLGVDYMDRAVYVPVAELVDGRLPAECKVPDVLGKYEVRRVEDASTPIKMWAKDNKAAAYVLQAVVEHEHLPNGNIRPSGLVTFTAWQDAVEDWQYKHYSDYGYYYCTFPRRRPMTTLPLPVGVAA